MDFEPVRGSGANKRRPAVIVSNDRANTTAVRLARGVLTVVPLTGNASVIYPFQVLLPAAGTGLRHDSKAQAERVRSVDLDRVGRILGRVPADSLSALDDALRLQLTL